jgi:two-component system chemotaxis response regulator CheY
MKILLAEDNAVTATLMKGILARHGYEVVLAHNGSEAVCLLGSVPDIEGVITDVMMPESSGLDLLRAMRENEAWRDLPAIVITVRDDGETVAEAAALGCKEYILKPIRPARLIERLAKVFRPDKVVLMSSAEVVSRYSLSPETYRKIARNFSVQIDQAIALVQGWPANQPVVDRGNFVPIVESATLMGAERLIAATEEVSSGDGSAQMTPQKCAHILDELKRVQQALSIQMR